MSTERKGILPPGRIILESMRRVEVMVLDQDTGNERTVLGYQYQYVPVEGESFLIASEHPTVELTGVVT